MIRPIKTTAAILILVSSTVSLGQSEIIIPMDLSLNRPVIALFVNSQGPYSFILDTGASGNVIDKGLASRLDLKEAGKVEVGSPGSDKTTQAPLVNVSEIQVSGQSFSNLSMVVMDLREMIPVDGVLSFKEFSEYLFTIDYPNKKILLFKGELSKDHKNVIVLSPEEEILTVAIEANERTWNAHLDTGSPFSFSFPFAFKDRLKFKSSPVLLSAQSQTLGGRHQNWRAELDGCIKLADIIFDTPDIILSDRNNEYVNIGYQLLKDLKVTIDQKNKLIQFSKSKPANTDEGKTQENDYLGILGRYGSVRSITLENNIYYIQRDGSLKLKLVEVSDNLFAGKLPAGMRAKNELPKIRFERDDSDRVIGLTFIYPSGREDFVKKDDAPIDH